MANNDLLFNAAIAGGNGGIFERWITENQPSDYVAERNQILVFAGLVDAAIPVDPTISVSEAQLLEGICAGVLSGRYLSTTNGMRLEELAIAIAALYTEMLGIRIPNAFGSSQVVNDSTVTGTTVTDALDDIETEIGGLTPSTGYISRRVYINAADPDVGLACGPAYPGLIFRAATTFTLADLAAMSGNNFEIVCWGSGAAGPYGVQQTIISDSVGGEMGVGGGARVPKKYTRADLFAALTLASAVMTIPARTASTVPPTTGSTPGTGETGSPSGSVCSFGNLCVAGGGGGGSSPDAGAGANTAGGAGGGEGETGTQGTTAAVRGGAGLANSQRGAANFGAGLALGTTASKTNGLQSIGFGGASGGRGGNQLVAGGDGGQASSGGGGGAAGAGTGSSATNTPPAPGAGGASGITNNPTSGGGGIAGTPGTSVLNGGNGGPGADQTNHENSGAGGGSGGASPRLSGHGGDGGDGGNPAGAGGTGGLGRGANGTQWRGRGGRGGRAQIVITGSL